jgi:NAD+ synthase (glutamine-hydrolysing)
MNIALAQLNFTIGAFDENAEKIIHAIKRAKQEKAALVVFSELAVCGYPPLDLLEHRDFIENCENFIYKIASQCRGIAAIVGAPSVNPYPSGKNLFNSAYFLAKGMIQQVINKTLLPTYDIFDEYRYFEQNNQFACIKYKGYNIAVTICEDLWYKQPILTDFGKGRLYGTCPMDRLISHCPDFVINIAASPFSYMQYRIKTEILTENARKYKIPIYYVNQVGAQTELIFDGGSMVVNPRGIVDRMNLFKEDFRIYDTEEVHRMLPGEIMEPPDKEISIIHDALVIGIRDYFGKTGLKTGLLGLSGGIDSAVTLVLASKALGVANLRVLLLPSQYSSEHSITDAMALADTLGVRYDIIDIREIYSTYTQALNAVFKGTAEDITEENIQARIRGNLLMSVSNKFGDILLNTSNKSEGAVGYGTLYGDMSGGLSVLGDVYKTDVYRLAAYINREKVIIPRNTIEKAPSAELRLNQKDTDSLPAYEVLDRILFNYIEMKKSAEEITQSGIDKNVVEKTINMVNYYEYKRYQAPPILRISSKAFGAGRRMPLVAKY